MRRGYAGRASLWVVGGQSDRVSPPLNRAGLASVVDPLARAVDDWGIGDGSPPVPSVPARSPWDLPSGWAMLTVRLLGVERGRKPAALWRKVPESVIGGNQQPKTGQMGPARVVENVTTPPRGSLRGVVDSHVPAQQEKSELLRILSSSATAAWQLSPAMSRVSWLASLGDSLRRFRDRTHWHPLFCPAVPDTPLACMLGTTHSVLEHAARLARHHRQCPTGSPLVVVWPST